MTDDFLPPNVVEQHRQLNMLIEAAMCDLWGSWTWCMMSSCTNFWCILNGQCMVIMNIVWWMNLQMYIWCLLVLTFDVWWMSNVWWIMVIYMFNFWYWLLMDNGCLYICLASGTHFWWMIVVNIFILRLDFYGSQ
jgi:hypothetical protein